MLTLSDNGVFLAADVPVAGQFKILRLSGYWNSSVVVEAPLLDTRMRPSIRISEDGLTVVASGGLVYTDWARDGYWHYAGLVGPFETVALARWGSTHQSVIAGGRPLLSDSLLQELVSINKVITASFLV